MQNQTYIGRFAPTPTGPLHMGSLVAAVASYLDAKAHGGRWLLRMEDLDPPRESPEAKDLIPHQLATHGLHWDGPMESQSQNSGRYETALSHLKDQHHLFPCTCSRKLLSQSGGLHQGNCHSQGNPAAWRLLAPDARWSFVDRVYGEQSQHIRNDVGDQVLKRKDGLYAYQLAVVVDDAAAGITHVVRGADLLDNTQRQLYLQRCLGYPQPSYLHLPLVTNHEGQKLSKQNQAKALDLSESQANLFSALQFLNQQPPEALKKEPCSEQLAWAVANWTVAAITPSSAGILG